MRPPGNERGRPGRGGLDVSRGGVDSTMMTRESPVVVDGAPALIVFDSRWMAGYQAGLVHGIERGRQLADDEAAAVHRQAVDVVHLMAEIEPHEVRWHRAVGA